MEKSVEEDIKPCPPSQAASDAEEGTSAKIFTKDEYLLATLGYKQEFARRLGYFENWAGTFTCMNTASGIPVLFGFAMIAGGPTAAFSNWTMVGGFATIVSLTMAEIAAALPTAGGIYYWAFVLGGSEWGPFLAWMTGWWNWVGWIAVIPGCQQGSTNFLISALEIQYPNATVLSAGWFSWLLTSIGIFIAMLPNVISQRILRYYFRFAVVIFHLLILIYWTWLPISAKRGGGFQSGEGVFRHFYNGINEGNKKEASDAYCWLVGVLFGAWVFYGYDTSVHLAEETHEASETVAKGMWTATLSGWMISVPTLIVLLFCIQDFDGIIGGSYANNFAEYLVQLIGPRGATATLSLLWLDSTCATVSCFTSAQRVTYAVSRDGLLPGSQYFRRLSPNKVPRNAAYLAACLGVIITTAVIGSEVAFTAITATATIATNASYLFPIVARQTIARKSFVPAPWNLGRFSTPLAIISTLWISFLCIVLLLPQVFPVTGETLNYAPIMIGGISIISVAGWWLPFRLGGRYWFEGPKRTISEEDVRKAVVEKKEG